MGSIKYIHNRKSLNYIKDMIEMEELNEEVNEILKKDAEKGLKKAQELTIEKYNKLKNQRFKLLIHINSPEIVIGLKNSSKAVIFLPGKLTINNHLENEDPEKIRRYNIFLQNTCLKFSRSAKIANSDWIGILDLKDINGDSQGIFNKI